MKEIKERLYFVDWLRTAVIVSLIPYHAALTYSGLGDIYIKKPVSGPSVIPFIFVTMPLDNFFMTLLFFLSGISVYYSMNTRGGSLFIRERVSKLLKPFLLGTIGLCPLQAYSMALYNGYSEGIFRFMGVFFSGQIVDYLGYAHLWFLLYLLVFTVIAYPIFKWSYVNKNKRKLRKMVELVISKNYIYLVFLWIIIVEGLLRPYFPGMQVLIWDWANVIVYLSVFTFGFIYAFDDRIHKRLELIFNQSIILVLTSGMTLFAIYYYWLVMKGNSFAITRLWAVNKGIYEVFLIVLLMVIGRRYFNFNNRALVYLKKSSFVFYLFHMLAVTYITLIVIDMEINDYIKYAITVVGSLFAVVAIYEMIKRIRLVMMKI